ncbi:U-box domain-containing protein 44 isoform B [Glycine soja]|uniref:U-box domain-containing protein 44 isoform A n=1 Tax=Glycine soja TaxID=3848 RepID=A0A445L038_GLYSO|nr:U-box domain-containing protein 44 isoform A [Glycine soja]RZC16490.1 U-box domain-containing protein 44 isoform B [Glycine soja]
MNVRFSGSAMKLTGEIEEEIVNVSIDDVVLQLKNGKDEEFAVALLRLKEFMRSERLDGGLIDEEATLSILFNRLGSCKADNRLTIIRLLRSIALGNDEKKEKMVEIEFLSAVVKSLTRDSEERKEAVGLLLDLSDIQAVRRRIGRIQGCIVMLVAILNGDDPDASHDAAKLLDILSSNTQNALHMAEAGYFRPLVQYLKEGSDMNKILMAKALSRLELTDHSKLSLGEAGAIEPLANMFSTGSGIAGTLLQLLFSVTSVLMTLREPASAILARIAQSESILVNDDVAQQMLSLLNFSSPIIQGHLLEALNNIASHPGASKVRSKMKEKGALQLLLPFLKENTTKVRSKVLQLLYSLSKDLTDELTEHLNETHLFNIVNIISTSTLESERAAAVGILSNLPNSNKKVTDIPKRANLLPILISIMYSSTGSDSSTTNNFLNESIASVIIRFTIFSDKKLQLLSAEQGVILLLVKLLSSGSPITKSRAAISLVQLSQNSLSLRKSRKSSTFCLVKAGAVSPLIQLLEDTEREVVEAALHALSTLLLDEIWEGGVNSIAKLSGVEAIIKNVQVEDAKVILIDLAQKSDSRLKSTVAKVLAELELLQSQSSYF